MKRNMRWIGALLAAALFLPLLPLSAHAEDAVEEIPILSEAAESAAESDGFVVKLRQPKMRMRLLAADEALHPIAHATSYYTVDTLDELRPYFEAGLVESVDPNVRMELFDDPEPLTNDTDVDKQWYLNAIHIPTLWEKGYDGNGVTIAVIDSGVLDTHEDLVGANVLGRNFCGGEDGGVPQYTDKYTDTSLNGHGTFVTGMLTARRNNAKGVAGMLDNVRILSLRCFSPNNTAPENVKGNYVDTIISAVGYAMEQGADVINMSLGVRQPVPTLEKKLKEASDAGILLVAAAGNYGIEEPDAVVYPAAYDFVISVGATMENNHVTDASQKNDTVTVAAPGNAMWSTNNNGGYRELSGTSLAAPLVAAFAAVAKQKDGKIDHAAFLELIRASVIDLGDPGRDDSYGWGLLDAALLCDALEAEYTIAYETDGGALSGEYRTKYRIGQDTGAELPVPTRGGYDVFAGWYLDEGRTKGPYASLPAGCAGDLTLYAGWTQKALPGVTVRLVGLDGMADVDAEQEESGVWTAELPAGTKKTVISSLTAENIEISGIDASVPMRDESQNDGSKWHFTVEDTDYVLSIPAPKPLRLIETWNGTATPASLDGKTKAISCTLPVAQWFEGDILAFAKATADLPKALGTLGVTADKQKMIYTPSADAAGQDVVIRIYARSEGGLSEPVTVTVSVGTLPVSEPVMEETEAVFEQNGDAVRIGLKLYGYAVSGLSFGGEPLDADAYELDGQTLVLKTDWLNTLALGDYTLTLAFTSGTSKTVTLKVRIPRPTVALLPAYADGNAAPASLDGVTEAVAYTVEDISAWFAGTIDAYVCEVRGGAAEAMIDGAKLTYVPAAKDAESIVTLLVRAKNTTGESDPVTVEITVGELPLSDPKLQTKSLTFQTNSSRAIAARVNWNGASLKEICCDGEVLTEKDDYEVSAEDNTLTLTLAWLKTRKPGSFTLTLTFKNCRTDNLTLELPLTVSKPSAIDTILSGIAQAQSENVSLSIPEAGVDIVYKPSGGKALLDIDDAQKRQIEACDTITLQFPANDVIAAELSEKLLRAPKTGTILQLPGGRFFIRSTAPVSGNRTFSISAPSQNVWYLSFTGDTAGVTALLPCAAGNWQTTLRTGAGERNLPCVYDEKEGCLRVVMPESGTLLISPADGKNPFTDVAETAWYYDAVQSAYTSKLLQGVSEDTFAPDAAVSRAMLVTILWRLAGQKTADAARFTDVQADTWYTNAAAWTQAQGLVNGYPDGSFRPDAPVSRQELMTILWRFAAKHGADQASGITAIADFADAEEVAEYAKAAVSGMVQLGIVNGVGAQSPLLLPQAGTTRAQLAAILERFVEHLSGKERSGS